VVLSPRPSRAERMRRPVLAIAALALVGACGTDPSPGVTVTNAQSDIVFGNPNPATPPATSGFVPVGPGALPPPALPPIAFPSDTPIEFPTDQPAPERNTVCPGPFLGGSAASPASTVIEGKPKAGFHLWQLIESRDLGNNIKVDTAKYTNYEVRNVSETTSTANPQGGETTAFTYDLIAPIGKGHTLTYTYQVKQNAIGISQNTGNVGQPVRIYVPDAGVSIVKEVEKDEKGAVVGSFAPLTPVLILPLPIAGGATFNGIGLDPATGSSLSVQGTVIGPDRVITCTENIQAYRVEATVTSSGQTASQTDMTVAEVFHVLTQGGALVVGTSQTPSGSKITHRSIIGDTIAEPKATEIPKDKAL
jgi:hypothetical protein